jgi:D-glycero-D-manno-heptose 1,7-bisphosphate phosphatase
MNKQTLVCLDRDGTINKDVGWLGRQPNWRELLVIYDGVVEGICRLKKAGIPVVVTTNQSGVARDFFPLERIKEVNNAMDEKLRKEGAELDGWYFCPYLDREYLEKYNIPLTWLDSEGMRKPEIGMIERAIADLNLNKPYVWVIGDKAIDVQTAINANGSGILVPNEKHPDEDEKVDVDEDNVFVAKNFLEAVDIIINNLNLKINNS